MKHTRESRWQIPFFTIWTGQQLSLVGSSLAQFALVWWLTKTTGSATVLAVGELISVLPWVVGGPFAGALVDRWNRRVVMIVADSIIALVSAWLAYLFWRGDVQFWHVYVILAARALGGMFHVPAMMASTSLMVPQAHLPRVSGLNQAIQGALNVVSPPLGALLLAVLPMPAIMSIDVITAVMAIGPLLFVFVPQPQKAVPAAGGLGAQSSLWTDMRAGARHLWSWPGMVGVCILAMMLNFLLSPAFALLPLLVAKDLGGDALQLGWINSACGVGMVAGGLVLSVWGGFRRRIVTILVGDIGLGIGILVVGITPAAIFPLALAGMFFGSLMNAMCNGAAHALMQQIIAPEMQGRVFMLIGSLTSAMTPLGMAIAGPVADAVGVRTWFIMAGVVSICLGLGSFCVPVMMRLEENHAGRTVIEEGALTPATAPVAVEIEL